VLDLERSVFNDAQLCSVAANLLWLGMWDIEDDFDGACPEPLPSSSSGRSKKKTSKKAKKKQDPICSNTNTAQSEERTTIANIYDPFDM
jgi:hypothetical protein